ncbi:MAG: L,D-transpeptidase, partial [Ilumatobacteraceae bacterium]
MSIRMTRVWALLAALLCLGLVAPTVASADGPPPIPENSGMGRRIVYDMGSMRVWLVDADESLVRTYLVAGHAERTLPGTGTFWVYSKVRWNFVKDNEDVKLDYMMRFAVGDDGLSIGFHAIPRTEAGGYIHGVGMLGRALSHGCVREAPEDAAFLWDWADVGTPVVVIDSSGRVPESPARRRPRGTPPPAILNPWAGVLPAVGA